MNKVVLKLAFESIRYRKSAIFFSVISIALSVVLLLGIERIRHSVKDSFSSTISGTDLIVGARTGNLSLLLSTVFHKGNVNQNMSWDSYKKIKNRPEVQWTIPISLGDSHNGFPVIGTTPEFFKFYKYGPNVSLVLETGQSSIMDMNCVLGSNVAKKLTYQTNSELVLTHGMGKENFMSHKEDPFRVSGLLSQTGTPVDNCIFVSLSALDHIHEAFYHLTEDSFDPLGEISLSENHTSHQHHDEEHPENLTGLYIGLKNKSDILKMQRFINDYDDEALLAILPAVTLLELWSIVKPIENVLFFIAIIVLLVSIGSIVSVVINTLNQRRREMAVLRSIGARPNIVFRLIIIESAGIILIGEIIGLVLLILLLTFTKPLVVQKFGFNLALFSLSLSEVLILTTIILIGTIIGTLPAIKTYNQTLVDGLTIKT